MAFERSYNPMVLLGQDNKIAVVNQAFEESFGYHPDDVVGRSLDVLAPPEAREQVAADRRELERTGSIAADREALHADGRRVKVQFAARRVRIDGRDVSLAVELGQQRRPARSEAAREGTGQPLTPRELEVIAGIAMGQRAHEVARDLFIAPSTVRTHVRNAMTKVGARSQAQLVAIALTEGTLDIQRCKEIAEARSQ
jgi:PAS domain S-box-containing protein